MTDRQELLAFANTLANILGQGKEQSLGPGKWRTFCPAHPDEGTNPSLEISVDENIRLVCRSRNCSLDDIIAGCRARGVPDFPQAKRFKSGGDYVINQVAHEEQPPDEWWLSRFQKVPDHVYIYRHADGRTAFCVMRNDATEDAKKEIKPVCSAKPKKGVGVDFWIAQAFPPKPKLRPLYNLPDLVSQPDAPVLVVEGEKTADKAKELLPGYVVVTWAGGSSTVNTADWAPLTAREVVLWPDNDVPGIKCMKQLAGQIGRGKKAARSVRLVFDEEMTEFDKGFDLADEYKDYYPPLSEMLANAGDVDLSKMPEKPEAADDEELAEKLAMFLDKYVAVLMGKDVTYVDVTHSSPHHSRMVPYLTYSPQALDRREVDTFLDMSGKAPKLKKFLDVYLESNKKVWLDGYVYDPSTTERIVTYGENDRRLNLYCGLAWPPRECDPELYAPFIDHIKNSCQTPEEAAYLLEWLAFKFQFPDQMIGTMVVLSGRQGCGKTIVCDIIKAIMGLHNAVKIPMSELTSQFNSQYCNKLFLDVEEYNPGASKLMRELREKVKNLVTSETMMVNTKGIIAYENKAYHSIIATTNSPNPEEIGFDNRRMTFLRFDNPRLKVKGAAILDDEYFKPLVAMIKNPTALQGLCHYLSTLKIDVGKVMKPFDTKMTEEAKAPVDQPEWGFLKMLAETGDLPDSEYLPTKEEIYPINRWPMQAAALPRKILTQMYQDYCWQYRRETITPNKAGKTLMDVLPSNPQGISADFDIYKTKRWEIVNKQGISTEIRSLSICLPNQDELRELVEKALNQMISWPKVTKDTGKSDDVVVEFPNKQF